MFPNKVSLRELFESSQRDSSDVEGGNTQSYAEKIEKEAPARPSSRPPPRMYYSSAGSDASDRYYSPAGSDTEDARAASPTDIFMSQMTTGQTTGKTRNAQQKLKLDSPEEKLRYSSISMQRQMSKDREESRLLNLVLSRLKKISEEVSQAVSHVTNNTKEGVALTEGNLSNYLGKMQMEFEKHHVELMHMLEKREQSKDTELKQQLKKSHEKIEDLEKLIANLRSEKEQEMCNDLQKVYFDNSEDIKEFVGRMFQRHQQDIQQSEVRVKEAVKEAMKQHSEANYQQTKDATDIIIHHVGQKQGVTEETVHSAVQQNQERFRRQVQEFVQNRFQDVQQLQKEEIRALFKQQQQQLERDRGNMWRELLHEQSKELSDVQAKQKEELVKIIQQQCAGYNQSQMEQVRKLLMEQWQKQKQNEVRLQQHWQNQLATEIKNRSVALSPAVVNQASAVKPAFARLPSTREMDERRMKLLDRALESLPGSAAPSPAVNRAPGVKPAFARQPTTREMDERRMKLLTHALENKNMQSCPGKKDISSGPFKRPQTVTTNPMNWCKVSPAQLESNEPAVSTASTERLLRSPIFANKKFSARELFRSPLKTGDMTKSDKRQAMAAKETDSFPRQQKETFRQTQQACGEKSQQASFKRPVRPNTACGDLTCRRQSAPETVTDKSSKQIRGSATGSSRQIRKAEEEEEDDTDDDLFHESCDKRPATKTYSRMQFPNKKLCTKRPDNMNHSSRTIDNQSDQRSKATPSATYQMKAHIRQNKRTIPPRYQQSGLNKRFSASSDEDCISLIDSPEAKSKSYNVFSWSQNKKNNAVRNSSISTARDQTNGALTWSKSKEDNTLRKTDADSRYKNNEDDSARVPKRETRDRKAKSNALKYSLYY